MIGRQVRFTAEAGRGDELATLMLDVARSLRDAPGCAQYVISREAQDGDSVWVSELWESQAATDAALEAQQTDAGRERMGQVMALLSGAPQVVELVPLGGVGVD